MNIPSAFWLVPVASVAALGMAWFFFRQMMHEEEGTPRMKEIAGHVRRGAMAYLKQQYKVVGAVFVILALVFAFMAYVLHVQNPWVPFAFLTGGLFSGLAGFFGYEDSHIRICTYGQRCTTRSEQRTENSISQRSRHGTCGCRPWSA